MAELSNTFSWSPSRARLFASCRRAYYFNHYGMWGGWSARAPERARLAYRLKHLGALPLWAGTVVHRTIEQALRDRQQAAELPAGPQRDELLAGCELEALQQRARALMVQHWRESRSGDWQLDPKRRYGLYEHYYGLPEAQVNAGSVRARDKVYGCLRSFCQPGGVQERLVALGTASWLSVESLEQFVIGDVPVWVQLDLAIAEDGGVVLIDWKTGQGGEEDREQLAVYALFARARWPATPPGKLLTELHYLADGRVDRQPVDPALVELAEQRIVESCAEMRSLLRDPAGNVAIEEDFPQCDQAATCERCRFRQLCER